MKVATKAERARKIIRELEINLDDAIGVEVMLSRTNDDSALRKAYDQTVEAYGCDIIRHTLLIQLAMALVRMHDPGTSSDNGTDPLPSR